MISVVIPCLDEAATLAECIDRAFASLGSSSFHGEVIVADNGSQDGSQAIGTGRGARVVEVRERGYGAAVRGGIAAAEGRYVVMGDADGSYDFAEIPRFIAKLTDGFDLVVGDRFAGRIHCGAMPWHHRYIGNPLLSGLGRWLFRSNCRDFHCGLRAFDRDAVDRLPFTASGMEFATEMIALATLNGLSIANIPIELHPDGRHRPPHLRSFRDGWRHLRLMISLAHKAAPENRHCHQQLS